MATRGHHGIGGARGMGWDGAFLVKHPRHPLSCSGAVALTAPSAVSCWALLAVNPQAFVLLLFLGSNKSQSIDMGCWGSVLLLIYSLITAPGLWGEYRYPQEMGTWDPPAHKVFLPQEVQTMCPWSSFLEPLPTNRSKSQYLDMEPTHFKSDIGISLVPVKPFIPVFYKSSL